MAQAGSGDGLLRWLVGGLVGGAIVLGLIVGAYSLGSHHEQAAPAPPPTQASTPAATTPAATASGAQLFTADACSGCHSLDGSAGVGPTVKGLAGSRVELTDGSTVTADDAYLERAITDPDAEIVKGFKAGMMSAAVASLDLKGQPQDVAALVAFIKAQP